MRPHADAEQSPDSEIAAYIESRVAQTDESAENTDTAL